MCSKKHSAVYQSLGGDREIQYNIFKEEGQGGTVYYVQTYSAVYQALPSTVGRDYYFR